MTALGGCPSSKVGRDSQVEEVDGLWVTPVAGEEPDVESVPEVFRCVCPLLLLPLQAVDLSYSVAPDRGVPSRGVVSPDLNHSGVRCPAPVHTGCEVVESDPLLSVGAVKNPDASPFVVLKLCGDKVLLGVKLFEDDAFLCNPSVLEEAFLAYACE